MTDKNLRKRAGGMLLGIWFGALGMYAVTLANNSYLTGLYSGMCIMCALVGWWAIS
jgi:hypothetical protein